MRHLGRFSIKNFTPRTGELLRDVKNMLIVVNTLLRKAAESGAYIRCISTSSPARWR